MVRVSTTGHFFNKEGDQKDRFWRKLISSDSIVITQLIGYIEGATNDFEKDYPEARIIKLEQNYRSTGNILNAANSVIKNNDERRPKNLWTQSGPGNRIVCYQAADERDEADFIITNPPFSRFASSWLGLWEPGKNLQ